MEIPILTLNKKLTKVSFAEGNGRAIREFIRELLEDMGYEINFFNIEYEEIIEASKYAVFDETKQKNLLKKYIKSKKELN